MKAELVNTGSELLLGRVLNTHQQWLCRRLADLGWETTRQVAVPDTGAAIGTAAAEALSRADLVLTTGGLGPTSDDLTRDRIAEMLGRRLVRHDATLERIRAYFAARNRPMPSRVEVQAQVPEGATVLDNAFGTAPGLGIEVEPGRFRSERSWLVMLPGPPRELRPMFDDQVVPWLARVGPPPAPVACVNLRTCGLGESALEERIAPVLRPWVDRGLEIGYCARIGEVDIRLLARGAQATELVEEAARRVRDLVGHHVFAVGDDPLELTVIRLATERGARVAVAESCTGGCLAHRLTNVPGASAVLWGGWITYDNAAKTGQLGVSPETLSREGAVSEACAREMAEGALTRSGADHALAVTGIAGPAGGTADKPVGTVFVALASKGQPTRVRRFLHPFDRETFKFATTQQALDLLRRRLSLPSEEAASA